MIKFKCPHCEKDVSVADEHAGKKGRCPGCKEVFTIPAAAAPKPVPAAERRTPRPAADEDEPPRKKRPARDDEEDEAVAEAPRKKKRARDEDDEEDEPPRKKKAARDDDEDEAVAEAPRKKKRARDDDEDDEDDRPARKRRARDEDDEEPEEAEDRPRKKKKRKGQWATCPNCGCRGDATRFYWQYGLGLLPTFFSAVRCNRCGTAYNGKHGDYNTIRYLIYFAIVIPIVLGLGVLAAILEQK